MRGRSQQTAAALATQKRTNRTAFRFPRTPPPVAGGLVPPLLQQGAGEW